MKPASNFHIDRRHFVKTAMSVAGTAMLPFAEARPLENTYDRRHRSYLGHARQFNIIVLGDSAAWGQGLADSEKYSMLLRSALQARLNRPVAIRNYAHSGAIIEANPTEDAKGYTVGREVPVDYPSITGQIELAKADLASDRISNAEVDLVLLDGGINDVNLKVILGVSLLPASSFYPGVIESETQKKCVDRMRGLLPMVATAFPTARIAVIGYWPIISVQSNLADIAAFVCAIGAVTTGGPGAIGCLTTLLTMGLPLRDSLIVQSTAFYRTSATGLSNLVGEFNRKEPGRFAFVDPSFRDDNAYAAPSSFLFRMDLLNPPDAAKNGRAAQCQTAKRGVDPICTDASMGHPNAAGAAQFAMRIGQVAEQQFVAGWLGIRTMVACLQMDSEPTPGAQRTATVLASDAVSGTPIAGTVRVGTKSFTTNTPFMFGFCHNTTVSDSLTSLTGKPLPGAKSTVVTCDRITVTAPGYFDVVFDAYGR